MQFIEDQWIEGWIEDDRQINRRQTDDRQIILMTERHTVTERKEGQQTVSFSLNTMAGNRIWYCEKKKSPTLT